MQVSLADRERCSMLFLGGGLDFSYDEPGPKTIDLDSLSPEQKTQLFYNWKRGVLAVDDEDALKSVCAIPTPPPKNYAFRTDAQSVTQPKDMDEAIRAREIKLRALLREKAPVILKTIPTLTTVELKDLLELEKITKNRKKLMATISDGLTKGYKSVSNAVGTRDVGLSIFNPNAQSLDNSLDVVESEMEDVTLIPSNEELSKSNG